MKKRESEFNKDDPAILPSIKKKYNDEGVVNSDYFMSDFVN